ncbi:hypothetical protein M8494_28695 [Serratia ureilytica]
MMQPTAMGIYPIRILRIIFICRRRSWRSMAWPVVPTHTFAGQRGFILHSLEARLGCRQPRLGRIAAG